MKNDNTNRIDISQVKWGDSPAPLLPEVLRAAWRNEVLPDWVCTETGLPSRSAIASLDKQVWDSMTLMSDRLRHYLLFLVKSRLGEIKDLKCIDRTWPVGLRTSDIAWSMRTRNCLGREGLLRDEQGLVNLTFGELFKIPNMGVMTVIDFCSTLEGAMNVYDDLASSLIGSNQEDRCENFVSFLEQTSSEEWSSQISNQDPRFSPLLPRGPRTVQELIEETLTEPNAIDNVASIPLLTESIIEIKKRITKIEGLSLEDALLMLLCGITKVRGERLGALVARLGWGGERAITLEEAGNLLGITRERLRQIQQKAVKRIPDHEVYMPQLDQALKLLEQNAPLTLLKASQLLQDNNITQTNFNIYSLLEAANLLGKMTTLQICDLRSGRMLVSEPSARAIQAIPGIAKKLASQSGVTNVYYVMDVLASKKLEIIEKDVRHVLSVNPVIKFLDEDWFWAVDVKDKRNRLRNVVRKILSVASPQSLISIRDGVRRQYTWRMITSKKFETLTVPPLDALMGFLEGHREFIVEGNMVRPSLPLDYNKELGDTERVFVDVLRTSPAGVMDRASLCDGCIARGMNESTFNVYATYSSIIDHLGVDLWKLRGVTVDPAAVEAVRIANNIRPKQKRVLEHGWSSDGNLWIAARVPRNRGNMVVGCPGAILRYLVGQKFECKTRDGDQPCGAISFDDKGSSWGYSVFIRRYGLDENDILLAEFDLGTNTTFLSVADEKILEDYQ